MKLFWSIINYKNGNCRRAIYFRYWLVFWSFYILIVLSSFPRVCVSIICVQLLVSICHSTYLFEYITVTFSLFTYALFSLPIHLFISTYLSVFLSACLSYYLFVYISVTCWLFISMRVLFSLAISLFISFSIYLSVSVCHFVLLSSYLSIYLHVSPSLAGLPPLKMPISE